jgi:hypothetical protein
MIRAALARLLAMFGIAPAFHADTALSDNLPNYRQLDQLGVADDRDQLFNITQSIILWPPAL